MRSPEINTPKNRSPSNRDKIVTEEYPMPTQVLQDVNTSCARDSLLPLNTTPVSKPMQSSSSGKAMRDAQTDSS